MVKATVLPPPALATLQDKFIDTELSMNTRLVERASIVKTALIALVSRTHVFYLGPPGTAKSMTIRLLRDHISGLERKDYFERLLTAFSTDADVFGPPDLMAMEQGVYRTVIDNKMAEATLAMLDEIWKTNDATANALLTILNERLFHNDVVIKVPLSSLYCASNELPQSTELEAIYDRLHFRHVIKPIQESSGFVQMLKNRGMGKPTPTVSLDDILQAQAEVAAVTVGDEVFEALRDLRGELRGENIEPTDRRWTETLPVIQATAWWRGGTAAEIDDMRLIRHMLWSRPDEISLVDTAVLQLASPLEAEAMERRQEVEGLAEDFDKLLKDADNTQIKNKRTIELHTKLEKVAADIENLEKRIAVGGRSSELVIEVKSKVAAMLDSMLEVLFHIDPSQISR